ncbi:EBF3-S protein [Aphelenchoides bicaudatus]|nr:EBF3-S protein [Aphelenchoides bicaudatus]
MSLKDRYNVNNVFVSAVTPENISRQQLLAWVNDLLLSNLTKIEEMSTGAAYCMLTDRLFPGSIPLQRVKWNVKSDLDSISNWKVVQNAWHDLGITKPVQVQTLLKGKFQDNFEFLQWFRRFYDHNNAGYDYDPLAARNNEPFPISSSLRGAKAPPVRNPAATTAATRRTTTVPAQTKPAVPTSTAPAPARKSVAPRPATTASAPKSALTAQQETKYKTEISELKDQISTWEKTLGSVESERDYYYAKLHKIELLCNDTDPEQTIKIGQILSILYKEEEEDSNDLQAFEAVEEQILHDTQTSEHNETNGVHETEEVNQTVDIDAHEKTEPTPVADIIDLADDTDKINLTQPINNGAGDESVVSEKPADESLVNGHESKAEDPSIEIIGEVHPPAPTNETPAAH